MAEKTKQRSIWVDKVSWDAFGPLPEVLPKAGFFFSGYLESSFLVYRIGEG